MGRLRALEKWMLSLRGEQTTGAFFQAATVVVVAVINAGHSAGRIPQHCLSWGLVTW